MKDIPGFEGLYAVTNGREPFLPLQAIAAQVLLI